MDIKSRKIAPIKGYRLISEKFVQEVNAVCYHFQHSGTGARVLKIAADDPNKTFGIAFATLPESDSGTPHILEHAVLNGSRNFPVKSPFDLLLKGSLHTFLNAFTGDEVTVYPVASMNTQDYFNLMHVYLDAVFYPLIYDRPRIFMQEGWHFELTGKDALLTRKGVVYNEMKGAFSNPEREMWYRIQQQLFPENGYRFSAGGYPEAIPLLTYEEFLSFHRRHYHPSNSYIYLYGDADLGDELAFIHREYLSGFSKAEIPPGPTKHAHFKANHELHVKYPVMDGAPIARQTYLSMNWVIGNGYDPLTVMALDILADVLVNQESAPMRKVIQQTGIGKDIYATSQNMFQNMFSIVVKNADPMDKDSFGKVIRETLSRLCSGKIDRKALEGSINRMEFRLREGNDAQQGVSYLMRILGSWIFTGDPFPFLEYEKPLASMRSAMDKTLLKDLIRHELMDNPYSLLAVAEPEPGMEKEISDKTSRELTAIQQQWTAAELDSMLHNSRELITYQQSEDSPEAMATIPLLKLSDIASDAQWHEAVVYNLAGTRLLFHEAFTNNIVYVNFWFDLRVLPEDKLPFAALLTEMLGKLDAGSYPYDQLDKALNINAGGYVNTLSTYVPDHDDNHLLPKFRIQMKSTVEKLGPALDLLRAIAGQTRFGNRERIHELLKRLQSRLESHVTQNGFGVASTRLESYFSRRGVMAERTRGLDYYWFVTDITGRFQANYGQVMAELQQAYDLLFTRNNLLVGLTCSHDDFSACCTSVGTCIAHLPVKPVMENSWALTPGIKNEGIRSASKVQYVLQGFDFRKLDLTWNGKWHVLGQILSTDWLQTRIRVIGGAYGGWAGISKKGTIYLASYRDPNLRKTLKNFRATLDYLKNFDADKTAMTRYIIGTISGLDHPLTPSERGDMAFRWLLEGTRRDDLQDDRMEVLATTAADIRSMHEVIAGILNQQVICVYGNDDKLQSNKDLFMNLVQVQP